MQNTLQVASSACIILFVVFVLILLFKGRKGTVDLIEKGLDTAEKAEDAAAPIADSIPVIQPYFHLIHEITHAAHNGVRTAQQLYSNDPTVDRKQVATNYVHDTLGELGVDLTDRIKRIVDAAIEGAVYVLPPKSDPPAVTPQTDEQPPLSANGDSRTTVLDAIVRTAIDSAAESAAKQVAAQVTASVPVQG